MSGPDAAALAAAARVRVSLVLGPPDAGKTTLVAQLASVFAARGERVAVVDADLGQSEIGPPTTLGLGEVTHPIEQLRHARLLGLEFVGDTSPARHVGETAAAVGRLVRQALTAGYERVLVDTGGLVCGSLGLALKRAKVRAVDPDLVIVVQRGQEVESLARALEASCPPPALRVPASPATRRRTRSARTAYRDQALSRYFAGAASVALSLDQATRPPGGPAAPTVDSLVGMLDHAGRVLGIGRVLAVDTVRSRLVVQTPVSAVQVARLRSGHTVWRRRGTP